MNMKGMISITTILIWLAAGLTSDITAQKIAERSVDTVKPMSEKERDGMETDSDLILTPGMDPYVLARIATDPPERFMQSGGFVNNYGGGVQYTLRPSNSRYFTQWFVTGINKPSERIANSNYAMWTGATFGLETLLTRFGGPQHGHEVLRTDADGVQIYARFGPGVGVMGYGTIDQSGIETHFGVHTTGTVGAMASFFRRSSFFVEGTAIMGYFPTLNELRMVAGPQLTIGFTLASSIPQHLYRY